MPNWCNNTEYIIGPKNELEHLIRKLKSWEKTGSLKDFAQGSGIGKRDKYNNIYNDKNMPYDYNGQLNDEFEYNESKHIGPHIYFSSLTTYKPMPEIWHDILRKHAPNCKYLYSSEEAGNQLYQSNDTEHIIFPEEYIIDIWLYPDEPIPKQIKEYFETYKGSRFDHTRKEVCHLLQAVLKTKETNITKLIDQFNKTKKRWLKPNSLSYIDIIPYTFKKDNNQL